MHKICAILLEPTDAKSLFREATNLIEQYADENNWYAFIGIIMPDGKTVSPSGYKVEMSDRWFIGEFVYQDQPEDRLELLKLFQCSDVNMVLNTDNALDVLNTAGKESIVQHLVEIVQDPASENYKRVHASIMLANILDPEWPFTTSITSWYNDRVLVQYDIKPENAAIVLVDMHM